MAFTHGPLDCDEGILENLGSTGLFVRDIERHVEAVPALSEVSEPIDESFGVEEAGRAVLQQESEGFDRAVAESVRKGDKRRAGENTREVVLQRCRTVMDRSLHRPGSSALLKV